MKTAVKKLSLFWQNASASRASKPASYFWTLGMFFAVTVVFLFLSGIAPADRSNWLAESRVLVWTVPLLFALAAYIRLSLLSLGLITLFLLLHMIGMHYNYGFVPFGWWIGKHLLQSDRNMYDRLVHFFFGFLLVYPVREVLLRLRAARGLFGYLVPLLAVLSMSAAYEIMEWNTVADLSTSTGYLFIGGTDPFDAAKDMSMAGLGALLALLIIIALNAAGTKRFWQRIRRSVRPRPSEKRESDFLLDHLADK